jgi:peptidoglycan/xylan/chitin deacetylase (PgdA/CDA1 family)
MYHRIIPKDGLVQAGMYVSPATFEKHLRFLLSKFNVVSLESLVKDSVMDSGNDKTWCVLTFDDGWRDFYDYAFPLLKKYKVPATVFLPTRFIGSREQFWTDHFAHLLSRRDFLTEDEFLDPDIRHHVIFLNGLKGSFEQQLEMGIEYLKNNSLAEIEKILKSLGEFWDADFEKTERSFLNWDEVVEMRDSGLISFGSHTVKHQILTTVDRDVVAKELKDSRKRLLHEGVVDDSFIPFCYPNGNYSDEIVEMVMMAGYHLAVTTEKGWNHKDDEPFTLKRIGMHEDMSFSTALFACKLADLI